MQLVGHQDAGSMPNILAGTSASRFLSRTIVCFGILCISGIIAAGLLWPGAVQGSGVSNTVGASSVAAPGTCSAAWSVVTSQNIGTQYNTLYGVSVVEASDAWAVGYYSNADLIQHTLIEHWDGVSWTIIPSPNVGTSHNKFLSVEALATDDVWAVGYSANDTGGQTLTEHWNGIVWSVVDSPNVEDGDSLSGVTAVDPNDVWAVGSYYPHDAIYHYRTLVEHWNGSQWSLVASPSSATISNHLVSVSAASTNDVWSVGYKSTDGMLNRPLIEHWNGANWSEVTSAGVGMYDNMLFSVDVVNASDIWAVGYYSNGTRDRTLAQHWNGTGWNVVSTPDASTDNQILQSLSVVNASDIWAVGYSNSAGSETPLTLHWAGSAWVEIVTADASAGAMYGVAATNSNDVWAVGEFVNPDTTLVERYSNGCFTPTPAPTACAIQFSDVPANSTFYNYVRCLACRGIISGYPDGTFRPNAQVTRGQLAKIVSNSAGFSDTHSGQTFQDVASGSTFYDYVERLSARSIVSGYACGGVGEPCVPPDNKPYFRPNAQVTRGQTSKIVAIAKNLPAPPAGQQTFEDVSPSSTFWQWVEALSTAGAISGYPCGGPGEPCVPSGNRPYFRPNAQVTRGQSAKIVSTTFFPGCSTPFKQ